MSISDLHRVIKILFFPEKFNENERFNLTNEQREILLIICQDIQRFWLQSREVPFLLY